MVKLQTYAKVVFVTLLGAYPFYEVISSLRDLQPADFQPCSEKPCLYKQLISSKLVPSTALDYLQLQNGVARPLRLIENLSQSEPVLDNRPIARSKMLLLGYFSGGFVYQWPNTNNTVEITIAFQICSYGFCLDFSNKKFGGVSVLWWSTKLISHAKTQVQKWGPTSEDITTYLEDDLETRQANADLTKNAAKTYPKGFTWLAYLVAHGFSDLIQSLYIWITGNSIASGPEFVHNATCGQDDLTTMQERCARTDIREKIGNPLTSGASVNVYLFAVAMWTSGKILHDILVLYGTAEEKTLLVGVATLPFQCLAVGSGLLASVGALEVFSAPAYTDHDHGNNQCHCYYTLSHLRAFSAMVVPLLLYLGVEAKTKRLLQASVDGRDYLFYAMFEVPYSIVHRNQQWESLSLLTPELHQDRVGGGYQVMADQQTRQETYVWACAIVLALYRWFKAVAMSLPLVITSSIVFPSFMVLLADLSVDPSWSVWHRAAMVRALQLLPATVLLVAVGMNTYTARWVLYSQAKSGLSGIGKTFVFVVNFVLLPFMTMALILPSWNSLSGAPLNSGDRFILTQLWSAGGFLLMLKAVIMTGGIVFGPGKLWAVFQITTCVKFKGKHLWTNGSMMTRIMTKPLTRAIYGIMLDPHLLEAFENDAPDLVQVYGLQAWTLLAASWLQKPEHQGLRDTVRERLWLNDLQARLEGASELPALLPASSEIEIDS